MKASALASALVSITLIPFGWSPQTEGSSVVVGFELATRYPSASDPPTSPTKPPEPSTSCYSNLQSKSPVPSSSNRSSGTKETVNVKQAFVIHSPSADRP
ncbi:hypothetical protein SAMN04489860_0606 [Paraoerskovia marina]|uniref:Uncharacterized protein n=1 Tax=Paraoerskovia marina TaxID=545619 RepID=A0A1H1NSM8_9CELL|nr:hypothetical protein SAMN04489860_0606 [Paraoerskovia marina]